MKSMFEPVTPGGFRVPNTNYYRAGEMGFTGGSTARSSACGRPTASRR